MILSGAKWCGRGQESGWQASLGALSGSIEEEFIGWEEVRVIGKVRE